MTANVLREAVDSCRQAGMDGFVPKPFQRAQIIEELGALAESHPTEPERPGSTASRLRGRRSGRCDRIPTGRGDHGTGDFPLLVAEFLTATTQLIEDIAARPSSVIASPSSGARIR